MPDVRLPERPRAGVAASRAAAGAVVADVAEPAGRPLIIQAGMGVGVSGWRLARAVAARGQLGVVSGVALDTVMARRLQLGDPDGSVRRALEQLPLPGVAERIVASYFVPGGIGPRVAFRPVPRLGLHGHRAVTELLIAANFAEVHLAKEGHRGPVGVNYLEKIQLATPASIYGAMLAGVDYVLMGAGIPSAIPALLSAFAAGEPGEVNATVTGAAAGARHPVLLDPGALFGHPSPELVRPSFLAIISSAVLASFLARAPVTTPDGFVLEGPVAGGHSAPPRGPLRLSEAAEPIYGPRDVIDQAQVTGLGLPFWLAGGYGDAGGLARAKAAGAAGTQVGSAFALCRESGIRPDLRRRLIDAALRGDLDVRNEPYASPAGFPFKVAQLPGTLADDRVYAARDRLCDMGYLRVPYLRADERVGYRCPAEPVEVYVRKGGTAEATTERRCLCNGLLATIGLPQRRTGAPDEAPLVTLSQDLGFLPALVGAAGEDFGAADVLSFLRAG
jgi:NAD(P)H-dependent flavin oxidoreductase YrpB (nitropropane dioxygenase family)